MFRQAIVDFLKTYPKTYVTLGQLEQNCPGPVTYQQFADFMVGLEQQKIIKKVAAAGTNNKQPPLANKYAVQKNSLHTHHQQIKQTQLQVHARINLDRYFKLSAKTWADDLVYIEKIDHYLKNQGLPTTTASMPQRSYELVGDEKWLESGGITVLQRIGMGEQLLIQTTGDPLMLAVNPRQINGLRHLHLVVENKTTYYALAEALHGSIFTTLVYGQGWKIVSNLHLLPQQLNLTQARHRSYYFGDLDAAGVSIWWAVQQRQQVWPALPFYQALLSKPAETGKQNQRLDPQAWHGFLAYFSPPEQEALTSLLAGGGYYPQEALSPGELQQIWSQGPWKAL